MATVSVRIDDKTCLCSRVLEKLTVAQQVKELPALYGTQSFITLSTTARHLF